MNPLKSLKNWVIGDALAAADDVFEKGKIEVLYNFTCLFLLLGMGFLFSSVHAPFVQLFLAILGQVVLLIVLITLKASKNVLWASLTYLFSHTVQNFSYMILQNGNLSAVALPFLILYISFGFLLLGRKWGIVLTLIVLLLISLALYNVSSGYKLFYIEGAKVIDAPAFLILTPLLLNAYLISEFFKTRNKAEKQIAMQQAELARNHEELAQKNKDTVASINYASRIQQAMLPTEETVLRSIPLSFILYKPRDIVCGDFYWFHEIDQDSYIIICVDCTGHGVPGALMTMIGNSILNQVIIDGNITGPASILAELDTRISGTLKQQKQKTDLVQDSMDLSLIKVDKKKKEFIFCGAKRPVIYLHDNELSEFKGNKHTLGGLSEEKKFEEIKQSYSEDDVIYIFSDGFADQFGGNDSKKFMIKQFRELLIAIHKLPMPEQKKRLENELNSWKRDNSQTDDILVIGIKF